MTRYSPKTSIGSNPDESLSTHNHQPCEHCGKAGHAHDKEREQHENGWSYNYVCPTDE